MASFLVTGGGGFIGSNIVEELLRRRQRVRVLDNFATGRMENIAPFLGGIDLHEGDVRSYHHVSRAVKGMDFILHQAALPSVPRSIADPITSNDVNVNGTLNILTAAKEAGVKRVVFASSSSIYGSNPALPKREEMVPAPMSPYAVNKLTGEKYCIVFSQLYGLETVMLRYFNVFGPKQDPNSQYSAVIPRFIKAVLNGERPVIYGDGKQTRDFTYVQNVVEANLKAASVKIVNGVRIFNIAGGQRISLLELLKQVNENTGGKTKPVFDPGRPGEVKHSQADIRLARRHLGYKGEVRFSEGIRRTVEWYMENEGGKVGR